MAFTLHFPNAQARDGQSGSGDAGDAGSGGDEWVSELRLEIAGLGDVQVSLRMFREQLELGLEASSAALAGELAARREELETRLARCGFEAVSLHIGDREARND
nr:flagellar hook-length control protein FliK [Parahaliea mediterranea]